MTNVLHRVALTAATLLPLAAVIPPAAHGQTLSEALALAYEHSPDFKGSQAQLRTLDENVASANSGWRPTVSLGYTKSRQSQRTEYVQGDYVARDQALPIGKSVTLSLPLWNGSRGPSVQAAEDRVRQGRAALVGAEETVLQKAAQAYMDVVQGQDLLTLYAAKVAVLARQVEAMRAGYARHFNTLTELSQAEAGLASARAQWEEARDRLDTARATFRQVVGAVPVNVKFPAVPLPVPKSLAALLAQASHAPAVAGAEAGVKAAAADVSAATGQLLPTVSLQASRTITDRYDGAVRQLDSSTIGVSVDVPLYQGGAQWAAARGKEQQYTQARMALDSAREQARQQAIAAWDNLRSAQAGVASYEAAVRANQTAYQGMEAEYRGVGTRTYTDVLTTLQNLYDSRVNLLAARTAEITARFAVRAAAATLTARALRLKVTIYDPRRHYARARDRWFGLGD